MKKVLAFVMTIVMFAALAVPASAVRSPSREVPQIISVNPGKGCFDCKIVTWGQRDSLPGAKKDAFEAAKTKLKDAVPEGFACRQFVFHDVEDKCTNCTLQLMVKGTQVTDEESSVDWTIDEAKNVCAAYSVDMTMEGVTDVAVKQYTNGEWVDVESSVNGNVIVLNAVADAPFAIFMK